MILSSQIFQFRQPGEAVLYTSSLSDDIFTIGSVIAV